MSNFFSKRIRVTFVYKVLCSKLIIMRYEKSTCYYWYSLKYGNVKHVDKMVLWRNG